MTKISSSLFITTYEMPRHLALVCAALQQQTAENFEILFCDDGSGSETRQVIDHFRSTSRFPIQHLWQENKGFRKCKILNEAVRKARGDTFIFLDGDCIPHREFVRDHIQNQEEGYYLAGRRVELGPRLSQKLTPEMVASGYFNWPRLSLVKSALEKETQGLNRSLRIPSKTLRHLLGMDHVADLKGCNYSVSRKALKAINGFDEAYEGYGREDTDVEIRLQNYGLKIKSLKGIALQFHIWHPRREFTFTNDQRLDELKASRRVRCIQGLEFGEKHELN